MQTTTFVKSEPQPATTAAAVAAPSATRPSGSGGGNKKGTSAERRATHNAIERARRESLNGRFLQLAASLPAISDVRRPSKSLIVNKSLDFVADALNRETMYRLKIDNMRQENMQLREQLNKFLAQAGMEVLPAAPIDDLPPPMSEAGNNKKRMAHLGLGAGLSDMYELEDDDGVYAAGSEGEMGKTSPMSSSSAASSLRGSLSHSMPVGVAGFTPIAQNAHFVQSVQSGLMPTANGMAHNGASPSASAHSEDVMTGEHAKGLAGAANWVPAHFDAKTNTTTTSSHAPTYANLTFSGAGAAGMVTSGSVSQPQMAGFDYFMTSTPLNLQEAGSVSSQNGHAHAHAHAQNYAALRNMQQHQLQLQQQQQLQQHQLQQNAANQFNFDQLHHSHPFFDGAALQPASFMTVV